MNIIQNIEAFSLPVNNRMREIRFPKNFSLNRKFITRMHVLTNQFFNDFEHNAPVVSPQFLNYVLITLRNRENKIILDNMPAAIFFETSALNIAINDVVDWELSTFKITSNPLGAGTYAFLLAFEYETTEKAPVGEWSGCMPVQIPATTGAPVSLRLSDYTGNSLVGKKIVSIAANNDRYSLLHLREKTGKTIRIPLPFLSKESVFTVPGKTIFFENLQIDWENSFIHSLTANLSYHLTFYYYE